MKTLVTLIFMWFGANLSAQQLVYTPVNPNFGGNTFNYQWLLSSAEAQNQFQGRGSSFNQGGSDLEEFEEGLNRQLLGQLEREIFDSQFGDTGFEPGNFSVGDLFLEIFESPEGLVVNILDTVTGEQTQIIVPN